MATDDLSWQHDGVCNGAAADLWTPFDKPLAAKNSNYAWRAPRAACKGDNIVAACPVLAQCRAWSMATPDPVPFSMAGGRTPRERATLRAAIRAAEERVA